MTPERTQQLLPVMQAHAERKPIRSRIRGTDTWVRCIDPTWDDGFDYEVEPEPREWWMNLYPSTARPACVHENKTNAYACRVVGCIETVHVREVLP